MQRHDLHADADRLVTVGSYRADARTGAHSMVIGLVGDDLPCPWCGEATTETDASCRGCGRRFG